MRKIKIDEIVLFQFNLKDRHKIYAHARKSNIAINLFSKDRFLLCVYLPKKKITETDLVLDMDEAENFLVFVRRLKNNGIKAFMKVYRNHRYISI